MSVAVVAAAGPVNTTVAPLPPVTGVIVPEMENEPASAAAVKLTPATLAPLIVAFWLVGLKVKPARPGVTA